MTDDHVIDEMIEILPDEVQSDPEGVPEEEPVDDSDMTIVPEKEAIPESVDDEDADMKIVPERVSIEDFNKSVQEEPSETPEEETDEDADMKIIPEGGSYEDDYSKEIYELEHEDDDRELIEAIGASLQEENMNSIVGEVPLTDIVIETETKPWYTRLWDRIKKLPVWVYPVAGACTLLIVAIILIFATNIGRDIVIDEGVSYASGKMNYSPVVPETIIEIPDDLDFDMMPGVEVVDETQKLDLPETEKKPANTGTDQEEKKVHNILLLGEENLESGGGRGRSDLIMIATINEEDKSIKLTSIMRDILVAIPGYSDNRLNAAYAMGGVSLVYQTLANNLGLDIDNYALVNFESFENIIDAIGGVDIELTEEEASYLNRTNYISNEKYRNVKAGKNHLNGNQALGYCRIRKVGTSGREYSDFGRTSRQRMLLESVVASLKDMSIKQLKKFCDKCLPFVTTDIDEEALEKYIKAVFDIGLDKKIRDYRIPIDGTYSDANLRGMLVTKVDLRKNALELQEFIYGK